MKAIQTICMAVFFCFQLVRLDCAQATKSNLKNPAYPKVQVPRGKVWVKTRNTKEKSTKLVWEQVLRDSAVIETGVKSEVFLSLSAQTDILLYENTVVIIPTINWENFQIEKIILKKGKILWQGSEQQFATTIESDLFSFSPGSGRFVLSYDPIKASTDISVLVGSQDFSPLNHEVITKVPAGKKISFQGVFEEGEIAFDHLLKGKKIPKGNLSLVSEISAQEVKSLERESLQSIRQKELARIKKEEEESNKILPGQVCRKPNAKYNQCVWRCEGNPSSERDRCLIGKANIKCVRYRCNANGDWTEASILNDSEAKTRCQAKPLIKECDY